MNLLELLPNQIITLNDYPVYSIPDLEKYYKLSKSNKEIAYVPVIKKDIVKKYLDKKLLKILEAFEIENPEAKYFMLDGSHRTTAYTLTKKKVKVIIYENDQDITEAGKMVDSGKMLDNVTVLYDLKKNCEILNKHFNIRSYFMTVEQKTIKMMDQKDLPQYMIDDYKI
jgi:hypothetical protein